MDVHKGKLVIKHSKYGGFKTTLEMPQTYKKFTYSTS